MHFIERTSLGCDPIVKPEDVSDRRKDAGNKKVSFLKISSPPPFVLGAWTVACSLRTASYDRKGDEILGTSVCVGGIVHGGILTPW